MKRRKFNRIYRNFNRNPMIPGDFLRLKKRTTDRSLIGSDLTAPIFPIPANEQLIINA